MKGVSEVIAIILILMITISLAGLAYMFMSTTLSDVTASAGSTVDTTTSSMLTSFAIESIDIAKVYVRNTGQNALTSLSVYVNDEPAVYNITPSSIAAGQVGTITIYSFIPDGATVKITSPNGFSASKVARPCEKAVACWKFDESGGNYTYDSSPYGNTGTLVNGPTWTSGKYGSALRFDGSNDNVLIQPFSGINTRQWTITYWIKPNGIGYQQNHMRIDESGGYHIVPYMRAGNKFDMWTTDGETGEGLSTASVGNWYMIATSYDGAYLRLYVNGVEEKNVSIILQNYNLNNRVTIGTDAGGIPTNGTIDEVRIYNRAIY